MAGNIAYQGGPSRGQLTQFFLSRAYNCVDVFNYSPWRITLTWGLLQMYIEPNQGVTHIHPYGHTMSVSGRAIGDQQIRMFTDFPASNSAMIVNNPIFVEVLVYGNIGCDHRSPLTYYGLQRAPNGG